MNPPGGQVPWPTLAKPTSATQFMPFGTVKERDNIMNIYPTSKEDQAAETERQHKAAKRTLSIQEERDQAHKDAHIDSMLTTDAHVGKAAEEPHKDQAQEDLKVDKARLTGAPNVQTKPLQTDGKTTDEVVTNPRGAMPQGSAQLTMPQRAAAAAAGDATGGARDEKKAAAVREEKHAGSKSRK